VLTLYVAREGGPGLFGFDKLVMKLCFATDI